MGTREVYEEKLRTGNMYVYDPTMKPGLGSPRCPRCLSLLDPTPSRAAEWKITNVLHDATAVSALHGAVVVITIKFVLSYLALGIAGSGIGGLLSAIHGFNTGIPFAQKYVKGPKWLPYVFGLPAYVAYAGASAAFGGYALPRFTQLSVTSYYAASSASSYCISLLTRQIEDSHLARSQHGRLG